MAIPFDLKDCGEEMTSMSMNGKMITETTYQNLYFDEDELPEIKDWKVGQEYLLVIKVKETSHSLNGDEQEASFQVTQVGSYSPETEKFGDLVTKKLGIK